MTDYQVDLESFRGPLDLLLFLVKRNEVDVCDIPVARITEQYLDYLRVLELVDVERAGDFIVMAATLMEIKSKLLLPRTEEEGEEEADPRLELVRQLLEYKKFKDAAALLEERAERQLERLPRNPVDLSAPAVEAPLASVELWDLVSAFGRLMRETLALQPKQIVADETPIHVYMEQIFARVEAEERVPFVSLFTPPHYRSRLIGLFLATLELIKGKQVSVEQESPFGEIVVRKYVAPPPLPAERRRRRRRPANRARRLPLCGRTPFTRGLAVIATGRVLSTAPLDPRRGTGRRRSAGIPRRAEDAHARRRLWAVVVLAELADRAGSRQVLLAVVVLAELADRASPRQVLLAVVVGAVIGLLQDVCTAGPVPGATRGAAGVRRLCVGERGDQQQDGETRKAVMAHSISR